MWSTQPFISIEEKRGKLPTGNQLSETGRQHGIF